MPHQKKQILLVEPNDYHYQLIHESFAQNPFVIIRVRDPLAAKRMLKSRSFDLIVTEIAFSQNWLSELKAQQTASQASHTPLVVLTSLSNEASVVYAMKLGIDDYLVKNKKNLELLGSLLTKNLAKKKPKMVRSLPVKSTKLKSLMGNLKNIMELINQPKQSLKKGRFYFKQLGQVEKEIQKLTRMLKNWF